MPSFFIAINEESVHDLYTFFVNITCSNIKK
nr:MAG TPA: hypothetical protein [Caudoviricetes sp.]